MALKESSLREERLWPSAQKIKGGEGSREEHAALVNAVKPVRPYSAPVPPASDAEVHDALSKDKKPNAFAPRELEDGTPVAVRLDIPAYEQKNTWVVSVHHPKSDFTAGPIIGYDSVAHIDNPKFGVHPTGALNIASGKPKSTIATVHGNWRNITPADASEMAGQVHHDPEWRQVGMDPERHSYFYDRETQQPVLAADEALHIGPLVYAKNPVYDNPENYKFADGGEVDEDGITAYHGSPHDFEQFDTSKIGTGEGAQSYGHGLYFAESEPVAQGYRDTLSARLPPPVMVDEEKHGAPTRMQRYVASYRGDVDTILKKMTPNWNAAERNYKNLPHDADELDRVLAEDKFKEAQQERAELEAMRGKNVQYGKPGHMYEVHIKADPKKHFLDWDDPVEDQPHLIEALKQYVPDGDVNRFLDQNRQIFTGEDLHNHFGGERKPLEAAKKLQALGLRGIKYFDADSRPLQQGTKNYVVFDHSHVSVKRKYAKGGMVEGSPAPAPAAKKVAPKRKPAIDWDKKRDGGPIVKRALMVISRKA
jgi:hypothetical protein